MRINKITQSIQKWAKKIANDEKTYDKINNVILPIGETTIATGLYSYFIEKNKDVIKKGEKSLNPSLKNTDCICLQCFLT